MVHSYL